MQSTPPPSLIPSINATQLVSLCAKSLQRNLTSLARASCHSQTMASHDDIIKAAVRLALQRDQAMQCETSSSSIPQPPCDASHQTPCIKPPKIPRKKRARSGIPDSNWKALQKSLGARTVHPKKRRKREVSEKEKADDGTKLSAFMKRRVTETDEVSKVVALDCEMVGIGPEGREDALARVSVVNYSGDVLYDKFVRVRHEVTDYRTRWSGIRAEDITEGAPNAVELEEAQRAVGELIRGRVIVGHAIGNDLRALRLKHSWRDVRDTAEFYRRLWRRGKGRRSAKGPALRMVVASVLGVDAFQGGEHDSCEDARAALMLYKKNRVRWERELREGSGKGKRKKKGGGEE